MHPRTDRSVAARVGASALLVVLGACGKPVVEGAPPAATDNASTGEAAKARELEEKAQGYKERFEEIQASDMSPEEKAQAASELVDEQQRTIREADDADSGSGGDGPD